MDRADVDSVRGWTLTTGGAFGAALGTDFFGTSQIGETDSPGTPFTGGARIGLGYRFDWFELQLDAAYAYIASDTAALMRPPKSLTAHGAFIGVASRFWLQLGRSAFSLTIGVGLSAWFAGFLVDGEGTPEKIAGEWSPYGVAAIEYHLGVVFLGGELRAITGDVIGSGATIFAEPRLILSLTAGLWLVFG